MDNLKKCNFCNSICNKQYLDGGIFIKLPSNYPDKLNISEENKNNGLNFCSYMCSMDFLEQCQRETFKLNIKMAISED